MAFGNVISSRLSSPITSAAVPQKNSSISFFQFFGGELFFFYTDIPSSLQISSTVALVIPGKIFPHEGVNSFPSFS